MSGDAVTAHRVPQIPVGLEAEPPVHRRCFGCPVFATRQKDAKARSLRRREGLEALAVCRHLRNTWAAIPPTNSVIADGLGRGLTHLDPV